MPSYYLLCVSYIIKFNIDAGSLGIERGCHLSRNYLNSRVTSLYLCTLPQIVKELSLSTSYTVGHFCRQFIKLTG